MSRQAFEIDKKKFMDYKFMLKEDISVIQGQVKKMAKNKSEMEYDCYRKMAQISEIQNEINRINEKIDTNEGHREFIEDVHKFRGIQKLKHSIKMNKQHSKAILPNLENHKNLLKEVVMKYRQDHKNKLFITERDHGDESIEIKTESSQQEEEILDEKSLFNKQKMLDILSALEEDNLFILTQIQEKEFNYEDLKKLFNNKIQAKEDEISKVKDKITQIK